jgi:hypothetical protein
LIEADSDLTFRRVFNVLNIQPLTAPAIFDWSIASNGSILFFFLSSFFGKIIKQNQIKFGFFRFSYKNRQQSGLRIVRRSFDAFARRSKQFAWIRNRQKRVSSYEEVGLLSREEHELATDENRLSFTLSFSHLPVTHRLGPDLERIHERSLLLSV